MQVTYNLKKAGAGWEAPAVAPWLEIAAENASSKVWLPDSPDSRTNVGQLMYRHDHNVRAQAFGKPACYLGEGGSIPFMGSECSNGLSARCRLTQTVAANSARQNVSRGPVPDHRSVTTSSLEPACLTLAGLLTLDSRLECSMQIQPSPEDG